MTNSLGFGALAGTADLGACRVLVVDDAGPVRELIGAYLGLAGIGRVEYAANGREGLEKAHRFDPDLVILDIMMPEMDGFEVCRRLRADPHYRHLAILVQTALESPQERTEVFRAGATDLVTKPIHGPELIARARVHLENRLMIRDLENYRRTMSADLELARDMQEGLLPDTTCIAEAASRVGLGIWSHFQPSAELGGDMWSLHDLGDGRIGVAMVDFSGHGVSAALNTFRLHSLMRQAPHFAEPSHYLAHLNGLLVEMLPTQQFATMIYGIVDGRNGTFRYSAAGAPGPLLGVGDKVVQLDASGVPLGITRRVAYTDQTVAFPEGAFLFFYSDALIETADGDGAMLETEDVVAMALAARAEAGQGSPLAALLGEFGRARAGVEDDLTLLWLERRGAP